MRHTEREHSTHSLASLAGTLIAEHLSQCSEDKQIQFKRTQRKKEVFSAWNTVCQNTQEGMHVTGLYYIEDENKLLVYVDSSTWAQEIYMLREIIRARIEATGIQINEIVCRVSKQHHTVSQRPRLNTAQKKEIQKRKLTPQEKAQLECTAKTIKNRRLADALCAAEKATFNWDISEKGQKG